MTLEELDEQGLLLPEEHRGEKPAASLRSQVRLLVTALVAVLSAVVIWLGEGGTLTFVGVALFLMDLGAFLWAVFAAVEIQMGHLRDLGAGGRVEGLPAREAESDVPGV